MLPLKKTNSSNSRTKTANDNLTRSYSSTSTNAPNTSNTNTPRSARKSKTPPSFSSSLPTYSYSSYSSNSRPNSHNGYATNEPAHFRYRQMPHTLEHDRLPASDHESLVKIVARLHEANYNPSITQTQTQTTPQSWAPEFQDDDQMQEAEGLVSQIDNEVNGWLQNPTNSNNNNNNTQQYYSKHTGQSNGLISHNSHYKTAIATTPPTSPHSSTSLPPPSSIPQLGLEIELAQTTRELAKVVAERMEEEEMQRTLQDEILRQKWRIEDQRKITDALSTSRKNLTQELESLQHISSHESENLRNEIKLEQKEKSNNQNQKTAKTEKLNKRTGFSNAQMEPLEGYEEESNINTDRENPVLSSQEHKMNSELDAIVERVLKDWGDTSYHTPTPNSLSRGSPIPSRRTPSPHQHFEKQ